jgi:sulfite exporter TauE/SafE
VNDGVALLGAAALGLFGSGHCVAMCGGIAGAVALRAPSGAGARMRLLATVGAGRILGYALAGLVAGGAGLGLAGALGAGGGAVLRVLAGCVVLGMALVVAGVCSVPPVLERFGLRVWRHLVPVTMTAGGDRTRGGRALLLGLLWGWLPCGLVYGALGWAAATGRPLDGAVVMVAFGLGTLPATLVTGAAAARLGVFVRAAGSRRAAGALLAAFAVWTVVAGGAMARAGRTQASCHDTVAPEAGG